MSACMDRRRGRREHAPSEVCRLMKYVKLQAAQAIGRSFQYKMGAGHGYLPRYLLRQHLN